jgi:hypothetical protein
VIKFASVKSLKIPESVNRKRIDNTMAKRKRIDNTMAKRKRTKRQPPIYKTYV